MIVTHELWRDLAVEGYGHGSDGRGGGWAGLKQVVLVRIRRQYIDEAGAPIEITYRFEVAPDAAFDADYRVMLHVVDSDEERMWDDDHDPPVPTSVPSRKLPE